MSDIDDRLDRLESLVEQQQETIERQRERIAELECEDRDDEGDANAEITPAVSRRRALTAGGLLALLFGGVGTASANPQGQVGTSSKPLDGLYTDDLYGNSGAISVQNALDLVNSDSIKVDGTEAITFDGNQNVTIPNGNLTLNGNSLTDSTGSLTLGTKLDTNGNTLTDTSGELTIDVNSQRAMRVYEPDTAVSTGGSDDKPPNLIFGHGDNDTGNTEVRGATIGGGGDQSDPNKVKGNYATVGGGKGNKVTANYGTIGGGSRNEAKEKEYATVAGGSLNSASGEYSTVAGGYQNFAKGDYSFAAGRKAETQDSEYNIHQGAFVWGDGTSNKVRSQAANQVVFQAGGGMYVGDDGGPSGDFYGNGTASDKLIDTSSGAYLTVGGTWTDNSSRTVKKNISPVDGPTVLERVKSLPVSEWSYEDERDGVRHMGPMAEDFHDAFGLGADDKHIASLDTAGVALAAIKGLAQKLDAKDARIADQHDRIAHLESTVENRSASLDTLRAGLDDKDERIDALEAENDRLRDQNADLEARLDRIETHLGIDQPSRQGVTDD